VNHAFTVAGKELRSSLNSPLAWVFIGTFTVAAWGIFFFVEKFFARDEATMRGLFAWMPWLLWGVGPALTMSLWASERRLGTWEILATSPVSTTSLVLGKFLAAVALLGLALLFTLPMASTADAFGSLDWGAAFGGWIGSLLLGAVFIALGLLCSALVQDELVALVLGWSLGALLLLPGLGFWESLVRTGAASALRQFGFGARFETAARGLIELRDVVLWITTAAAFLTANGAVVASRRHSR